MEENNLNLKENKTLELKKKINFLQLFVFLFTLLFLVSLFYFFSKIEPPSDFKTSLIFTIEKGDSLRKVSYKLEEENFIKSRVFFEIFVIAFGGEKNIKTGDYLFKEKINTIEVARRISLGVKGIGPTKITIPEGYTNKQISNLLKDKFRNFDENEFLDKVENKEGYLFPDTYFFLTGDNTDTIIKALEDNFTKRTKDIFENLDEKQIRDVIIMASLIEGEASGDGDREIISGILWKRLSINMPLQVDVAPITYQERGLPKVPISNPGLKAINASMNPQSSSYLYYIHDKKGDTYFARNFQEHRINIEKYLK